MHTLYVCTYTHMHACTHCMCVRTHTHAQCAWTGHDHHQGIMCSLDISSTCGLLEVDCSVTNAKEQVHLDSLRATHESVPSSPTQDRTPGLHHQRTDRQSHCQAGTNRQRTPCIKMNYLSPISSPKLRTRAKTVLANSWNVKTYLSPRDAHNTTRHAPNIALGRAHSPTTHTALTRTVGLLRAAANAPSRTTRIP